MAGAGVRSYCYFYVDYQTSATCKAMNSLLLVVTLAGTSNCLFFLLLVYWFVKWENGHAKFHMYSSISWVLHGTFHENENRVMIDEILSQRSMPGPIFLGVSATLAEKRLLPHRCSTASSKLYTVLFIVYSSIYYAVLLSWRCSGAVVLLPSNSTVQGAGMGSAVWFVSL